MDPNVIHSRSNFFKIMKQHCRINATFYTLSLVEMLVHGTRCLKMLLIVNVEPQSRVLLINWFF